MPDLRLPIGRAIAARLIVILAVVLLAPGVAAADDPAIATGAPALVKGFADEGVSLLEDRSVSAAVRAERFRGLLRRYFATEAIARWVLGRYWNQFDAAQRDEYYRLFEDLVVYGYAKRFGEYTGERLRIVRTVLDSNTQATVFSEIDRPTGGQPINVDWRVGGRADVYRIVDVVVENVSLSQTWRSDFSATIQQSGKPAALLDVLRARTAQLKAEIGAAN